ncbi:hypothetical protein FRC06_010509 [Ceratobasidium sp. 370]|nr:hypothetical protein FRC06_010509 [Ceratobasidium sp. 370]
MSAQDLDPTEELVQAISRALAIQSIPGKVMAMREVFNTWGEVVPLVAEVGISLAATGTVHPEQNLPPGPIVSRPLGPQHIPWTVDAVLGVRDMFQRRLAWHTQGGDPQTLRDGGYTSWIQSASTSITENSGNLAIVKMVRAVPIIDILDEHHRTQIRSLYSATSTYSYSASVGPAAGTSFGDSAASPRTIRSIKAWFADEYVEGILITYENNVTAGPYGKCQGTHFDDFLVGHGEYITDLFVWADSQRIKGLRLVKNTGQMSSHFGNSENTDDTDPPQLLSNNTSVLAGLTGSYDATGITRLQAVWRNDIEIKNRWPTQTSFAGGNRCGRIFNDLEYIGDPYTARLSRITMRDGGLGPVVNLQTRYIWNGPSGVVGAETSVRGVEGAGQRRASFELDENEFIVQVMGTYEDGGICQIQFRTNKRTSPLFGNTNASPAAFDYTAPPGMRLYYLVGKSRGWVHSLLFVWAPIPDF